MDVKILSNVNPLKKMGLLSSHKKDSKHNNSPVRKLNGVVKFKTSTKEGESKPCGNYSSSSNGDVASGNNSFDVKTKKTTGIEASSNGTLGGHHSNDGSGGNAVNHGNQLSHVGSERRKWFVAKSSKSLGR